MKNFFPYFLFFVILICCTEQKVSDQILMPVANTIKVDADDTKDSIIVKAAHVVPSNNQYDALQNEFIAFIHFGPNTFTRMEWGSGLEDPKIFDLKNLDTDQWCKTMRDAGMKMVILTVKHHDGFVLWQSRYTEHGIMSSPFQNGKGDILRELTDSCKKYGLKLGIYLSPADLFQIESKDGLYGNLSEATERTIPRPVEGRPFQNKTTFTFKVDDYNEYFLNQLFELLTEYGPVDEVWFDGATPKTKGGQTYDYLAWKKVIRTLAPKAVIFGKEDIRWCGNESGRTRDTEWNVIPYQEDPDAMNMFGDLTAESLGAREDLYKAKYLHYQQAETNTSIREGWFYRDDDKQKVRSADDVFDIYERSVGGNSTFLLNIPPNREGRFSPEDVGVLEDVGNRIVETYFTNLFEGANGPHNVLDADPDSYIMLDSLHNSIVIQTKQPITINRLVLQEAIATHSERIEKHAVEAWIDNEWKQIAIATNVGYKRILRFPEVTSDKFRVRVLQYRLNPAISNVSAHYYKTRPPQLDISRNLEGMVTIAPKMHDFGWKPHGENPLANLDSGLQIHYTTDGTDPNPTSQLYEQSFSLASGEVRAVAVVNGELGSTVSNEFGIVKKNWQSIGADSFSGENRKELAFDANPATYWQSGPKGKPHYLNLDLGKVYKIKGFTYTPQHEHSEGMIEKGMIKSSKDGKSWQVVESFAFGNLINDPVKRTHYFKNPVSTRYIRIESANIAGGGKTAAIAEVGILPE
ncbi:alpha-L-fucosidase [Flavobacteriaceae bacterium F89]|uniref:alpha-L-fucosidase n=1 Tax=Cerina litoralis TaxID=2874477 RepID=A0AAE3EW14_9FLAO|nr:alpha-L-fucosidase [Cerina litoralis]MCG2460736.1 alpha-L-fucosidase [Cerina litoralis]